MPSPIGAGEDCSKITGGIEGEVEPHQDAPHTLGPKGHAPHTLGSRGYDDPPHTPERLTTHNKESSKEDGWGECHNHGRPPNKLESAGTGTVARQRIPWHDGGVVNPIRVWVIRSSRGGA